MGQQELPFRREERYYVVAKGRGISTHTSYAAVRLLHAPFKTFMVRAKAEEYLDTLVRQAAQFSAQGHLTADSLWVYLHRLIS